MIEIGQRYLSTIRINMARAQVHFEGEMCEECGIRPKSCSGFLTNGQKKYRARCGVCHRARNGKPWLRFRGESCDYCGLKPLFSRTLDVHHRDGDKTNNEPDNLDTICASCHREIEGLIHELEGNWQKAENMLKRFIKSLQK